MSSESDALMAENDKLRQSLFNLHKLFTDKFEAVALNEAAAQERDEALARLAYADSRLASTEGAAQELLELLSDDLHEELQALGAQLSGLARQLADKDALLAEREKAASAAEAQLQAALAAHQARLEQSALQLQDAEARSDSFRQNADAAMAKAAKLEELLKQAEETAAATAAARQEEHDTFDMIEIEKEEEPHRLEPVDFDEWKIKGLDDKSTGIMRLRLMLLDYRRPPATSLLETGEIRSLLQTVRQICVDRGLADSSAEPSPAQ